MTNNYNGWTNYETWLTNLWLSELFDDYEITDIDELANCIEQYVDENNPLKDTSGLYNDLLTAGLSQINYREIAEHILENK